MAITFLNRLGSAFACNPYRIEYLFDLQVSMHNLAFVV
jgi:hypothetical protein